MSSVESLNRRATDETAERRSRRRLSARPSRREMLSMTSASVSFLAGEIVSESSMVDSMGQAAASAWLDREGQGGTGSEIRENPILNLFPRLWVGFSRRLKKVCQISPLEDIRVIPLAEAPQVRLEVRLGDAPLAPNGMCSELSALDQAANRPPADVQDGRNLVDAHHAGGYGLTGHGRLLSRWGRSAAQRGPPSPPAAPEVARMTLIANLWQAGSRAEAVVEGLDPSCRCPPVQGGEALDNEHARTVIGRCSSLLLQMGREPQQTGAVRSLDLGFCRHVKPPSRTPQDGRANPTTALLLLDLALFDINCIVRHARQAVSAELLRPAASSAP